ncbi:hypothetical protein [Candidatus Hodarchaeum mangrovi]
MSKEFLMIIHKTYLDIRKRLLGSFKGVLLGFFVIILFGFSVFLIKPDFDIFDNREIEGEENDFSRGLGSPAQSIIIISIVPFVIWIYFKELIQYLFSFIMNYTNENTSLTIWKEKEISKLSKSYYFKIKSIFLNIHCIGCIISVCLVFLHMYGLFSNHNGISFLFAWIGLLSGIYISLTGLIMRFPWKKEARIIRRFKRISRMIHLQLFIAILGIILIQIHTSFAD